VQRQILAKEINRKGQSMKTGRVITITAVITIVALSLGATIGYNLSGRTSTVTVSVRNPSAMTTNSIFITSVGSETFVAFDTPLTSCCKNTVAGGTFDYPLSIEYSGAWIVHYWVQSYSGTESSIEGNLNGSGNSETWVTIYVEGYVEYTLCASATTLANDSSQYYPLTLGLFNQNATTTPSNPTIEVCSAMAV
jgi:hypothetical protein